MKTFYQLLVNALIVGVTNNFIWFALTFWIYLETQSVISTGFLGGIYLILTALSGFWFGSLVDHNKKKHVMLGAALTSLVLYSLGLLIFTQTPSGVFKDISSPILWVFSLVLLSGAIAGNIYNIAIPTLVTLLVPEKIRDKANGMYGTVAGIGFGITSVGSGFALAFTGMYGVLLIAMLFSLLAIIHLSLVQIKEDKAVIPHEEKTQKIDIPGTIKVVSSIPGLFALIFLTTFNNFLGGAFMALMDAYGLTLVSVEMWGLLLGALSFGFIFGGLFISKYGLGKNPLTTLFRAFIIMWLVCIFFTIQPSVILLTIGMLIWMSIVPFVEATEQTIIQKVAPQERQGRVFGFAQSVEQAASPMSAFLIGPIAQLIFIPFMSDGGEGARLIGSWFGTGPGRGIALVFITSGILGLLVTLIAMRLSVYKKLSQKYLA